MIGILGGPPLSEACRNCPWQVLSTSLYKQCTENGVKMVFLKCPHRAPSTSRMWAYKIGNSKTTVWRTGPISAHFGPRFLGPSKAFKTQKKPTYGNAFFVGLLLACFACFAYFACSASLACFYAFVLLCLLACRQKMHSIGWFLLRFEGLWRSPKTWPKMSTNRACCSR